MTVLAGKHVLLTGAYGFIGQALLARLQEETGTRLIVLSRSPRAPAMDGITHVAAPLQQLTRQIWDHAGIRRIDLVLHLGAFTPKTGAEADQWEPVFRDNLEGTRRLLESLPSVPERIVFASTLDVYAPTADGESLDESSPTDPQGLYGASKLFCEHLVRAYARRTACGYAILRYGHIFGPGEERYGKLIPSSIRAIMRGEPPTVYGDGSALRDLLYVSDAVEATMRAATSADVALGPVNIVRGASVPIREVVETLVQVMDFRQGINFVEGPPGRSLRFSNQKMKDAIGEWPLVSLEDGLRREVAYFKSGVSL